MENYIIFKINLKLIIFIRIRVKSKYDNHKQNLIFQILLTPIIN